jgi:hypothetical protein
VSFKSVQGGSYLESDGGDDLFATQAEEDHGASARQQFTIRHFESREPGDPFTRSLSVIGDEPDTERVLRFGDIISITAYTNRYFDADGNTVLASGQRQGEYGPLPPSKTQLFMVEHFGDDPFNIQEPHLGRAVEWQDSICLKSLRGQGTRTTKFGSYLAMDANEGGITLSNDPYGWVLGQGDLVAPLRVGFSVRLQKDTASRVQWYGRGPHESYADRCGSTQLGLWTSTVAQQTHRYVRPQENGNKIDTRWMALTDSAGKIGSLFVPLVGTGGGVPGSKDSTLNLPALSMQCHHFDIEDFDCEENTNVPRVRHGGELRERLFTTLCIDGAQAGIGGVDSWGSLPLMHYRLNLKRKISWAFAIQTFGARSVTKLPSLVEKTRKGIEKLKYAREPFPDSIGETSGSDVRANTPPPPSPPGEGAGRANTPPPPTPTVVGAATGAGGVVEPSALARSLRIKLRPHFDPPGEISFSKSRFFFEY